MLTVNSFAWRGLLSLWWDGRVHCRRHQHRAGVVQASFHAAWWLFCSLYISRCHQSTLMILRACGRSRQSQPCGLHRLHASRNPCQLRARFASVPHHRPSSGSFTRYRNPWDVFVTASFLASPVLVLWRIAWNPGLQGHPKHLHPCVFPQNLLKLCGLLARPRAMIWHSKAAPGWSDSWNLSQKYIFRPGLGLRWLYQILIAESSRIWPCC